VLPLSAALRDNDIEVRWKSAQALGEIGNPTAVDALVPLLVQKYPYDGEYDVRRESAFALGKIRDRRAVPALIACLERDTDGHVRAAAAIALGQLNDRQAAVPLLKALDDTGGAGAPASQALKSILGDEYTIFVLNATNDTDPEIRASAVFELGEIDQPGVVAPLIRLLEDRYTNVRVQAVNAMRKTSGASVNAALGEIDPTDRRRAEALLRRLNLLPAVPIVTGELPVPRPGFAHAIGKVTHSGKPRTGVPVYLHRVKPDAASRTPNAWTDDNGTWVVLNVQPGNYVTTHFNPFGSGLGTLYYLEGGATLVEAGTITDFGTSSAERAEGFR
jgi:hypothetical protein